MNTKLKVKPDTRQFVNQAWARNGNSVITGEALIIAMLLHTHGAGRDSDDMRTVQELMNDINIKDD